jgi:hypothetical protein
MPHFKAEIASARIPARQVRGRWFVQRSDLPAIANRLGLTAWPPQRTSLADSPGHYLDLFSAVSGVALVLTAGVLRLLHSKWDTTERWAGWIFGSILVQWSAEMTSNHLIRDRSSWDQIDCLSICYVTRSSFFVIFLSPFHRGNTGSNPVGDATLRQSTMQRRTVLVSALLFASGTCRRVSGIERRALIVQQIGS